MQAMTKPALRKALRQLRDALSPAHIAEAAHTSADHLSGLLVAAPGLLPPGAIVASYWPLQGELDPRPCMHLLHNAGYQVVLPVVVAPETPLCFRLWTPDTPLLPAAHGTSVPPETSPTLSPDVLFVPLLGFDRRGGRLGYGGGYYDRTLAQLRTAQPTLAIGFAFAIQERDTVPTTSTDQPLDGVLTECEWIDCRQSV